jgi:hypothetical protein
MLRKNNAAKKKNRKNVFSIKMYFLFISLLKALLNLIKEYLRNIPVLQ